MEFTPPFGPWLKLQRARLDLTQGDLARRVGYSPETIRKIEAGALKPSKQIVDLLADHLGVPSSQRAAFLVFATDARATQVDPRLTNLPVSATTLVGREKDLAAVSKLFKPSQTRLVTLLGPPGVGKTRLGIELARQMSQDFIDGAWFVSLAAVTEPQAALASVLHVLQASETQPTLSLLPLDALKRHLRDRQVLLVLDNLEQLLNTSDTGVIGEGSDVASLIAELLSVTPRVKVLATSREPLRIVAEQRYAVQPLPSESAVALFIQRARAVQPDFTPTPEVNTICARLDGLPLAIELAAARIEAFTPKELLGRLGQRLSTLTTGGRDLPERQRTLRATIDWSYRLLSREEQGFLRRMGVFAGGFTLHAAQTFCEIDNLSLSGEDGIAALVSKGLLVREPQPDGSSRYRMLETIREYALDKLEEQGERTPWQRRHAEYLVAVLAVHLHGAPQPLPSLEEQDNWRAALEWLQSQPDEDGLCLLLVGFAIFPWHEQLGWHDRSSARSSVERHPAAYAYVLMDMGVKLNRIGDMRRGRAVLEQTLAICRTYELRFLLDYVYWNLGHAARERGDFEEACAYYEQSERWAHDTGHVSYLNEIYLSWSEVYVGMEEADRAERLLNKGIALEEAANDKLFIAWRLNHLAHVELLKSDFERASALLARSIDNFDHEVNGVFQVWGLAWCEQSLGEIALAKGNAATAREMFVASLKVFDELGEKMNMTWSLCGLAGANALDEEPERSARLWGASEALRERIGCRIAPASRLNRERTVALLREQLGEAEFARLAAEGAKMTADEAVAYALKENSPNMGTR